MLITGCPRSGTAYLSRLFTYAGLPCGHEQKYNNIPSDVSPDNFRTIVPAIKNPKAESSWWAVPHLKNHDKIIHITRDPLKVISSMMKHSFLEGQDIAEVARTLPKILELQGIERYAYFWTEWNSIIEKHTKTRYTVEEIDKNPRRFLAQFIEPKAIYFNNHYNSWGKYEQKTLKDIPAGEIKDNFIKKLKQYGYG